MAVKCDVKKEEDIKATFEVAKKEFGGVDVCVSNAGLGHNAPLLSGSTQDWRDMLEVSITIRAGGTAPVCEAKTGTHSFVDTLYGITGALRHYTHDKSRLYMVVIRYYSIIKDLGAWYYVLHQECINKSMQRTAPGDEIRHCRVSYRIFCWGGGWGEQVSAVENFGIWGK